jgi:hypothetical protein
MNAKQIRLILAAAVVSGATMATAQDIRVSVDGRPVQFQDTGPRMVSQRVLVPLRGVFEEMGATVNWFPLTRTVTARDNATMVELKIGEQFATVNGKQVPLDVPALILDNRTMVPMRFLSEALGAQVTWDQAQRMVLVQTGDTGHITGVATMREGYVLPIATVLPVRIEQRLSSNSSRPGDTFTATIRPDAADAYPLPAGTRIEGRVLGAIPRSGDQPGVLELGFDRLRMPDGRTVAVGGSLIGLDDESVARNDKGVLVARAEKRDERIVFAGYGAGAGALLSVLTRRPLLEGALIGGILGYLLGAERARGEVGDVVLERGAEFGVRLDRELIVPRTPAQP